MGATTSANFLLVSCVASIACGRPLRLRLDLLEISSRELGEIGAFGNVLTKQAVGVFRLILAAGGVWIAEQDRHTGGDKIRDGSPSRVLGPRQLI